ncbi:HET-domain-containing protein [Pyrenophora tritici-repentis]|nr:HET-domain-containing protein [Pyrenophora tritici-repentis]KAI2475122.1 HET-domain-containing protein [Pyrenophora tritici-repentis]
MDFHNLKDPEYVGDPKFVSDDEPVDELVSDAEEVYIIHDPIERHPYIKAFERTNVESSPERFARTLTAGCWGRAGQYLERFSTNIQTKHSAACIHVLLRLLHVQEFGDEGEYLHSADSLQFEGDAYSTCQQRRMFWTRKKSYGLGPHCMRSGDVVVVLYGGNTPYVLRPRGNEYIFMGQAYVDEIMNGELFHDSAIRAPQEQIFCLI